MVRKPSWVHMPGKLGPMPYGSCVFGGILCALDLEPMERKRSLTYLWTSVSWHGLRADVNKEPEEVVNCRDDYWGPWPTIPENVNVDLGAGTGLTTRSTGVLHTRWVPVTLLVSTGSTWKPGCKVISIILFLFFSFLDRIDYEFSCNVIFSHIN